MPVSPAAAANAGFTLGDIVARQSRYIIAELQRDCSATAARLQRCRQATVGRQKLSRRRLQRKSGCKLSPVCSAAVALQSRCSRAAVALQLGDKNCRGDVAEKNEHVHSSRRRRRDSFCRPTVACLQRCSRAAVALQSRCSSATKTVARRRREK